MEIPIFFLILRRKLREGRLHFGKTQIYFGFSLSLHYLCPGNDTIARRFYPGNQAADGRKAL